MGSTGEAPSQRWLRRSASQIRYRLPTAVSAAQSQSKALGRVRGRAGVERERDEDQRDQEQQVHRALQPRLERAVARGVEMEQGGRRRVGAGRPVDPPLELSDSLPPAGRRTT